MGKCIQIGERVVGAGMPCFVIAEAGVNHNGDVGLARQLVDAAADAGADAVKFQTWITEKLVTPDAAMADYQRRNLGEDTTQFSMLKELELTYRHFRELKTHAEQRGIIFLSTPEEEDSADFLEELNVSALKIGSGEVTNLPFLEHVARKQKPLILSTGMSTLDEVGAAVEVIERTENRNMALLHCVSSYPADPSDCNLRAMRTLQARFGYPVGFSDHTVGIEVAVAAVAREACVLEKHLTLDKSLPGPDHRASIEPGEFAEMVRAIRRIEGALGDGIKRPRPSELKTKRVVQKSIVAARAVKAGRQLVDSDLALRRTSGGLEPSQLPLVVGRTAACDLEPECVITMDILR